MSGRSTGDEGMANGTPMTHVQKHLRWKSGSTLSMRMPITAFGGSNGNSSCVSMKRHETPRAFLAPEDPHAIHPNHPHGYETVYVSMLGIHFSTLGSKTYLTPL